jgi:nitrate reductase gamma subunit
MADVLVFARGPLFTICLTFFLVAMAFRLFRVIALRWQPERAKPKGNAAGGAVVSFLKAFLIFPFFPGLKGLPQRSSLVYFAGGIFHLSLFLVIFFTAAHTLVWESLLGFRWDPIPTPIIDGFTAATILALIVLAINRATNPVLRLLSGPASYLNLLFVFIPFVTGFIMYHSLIQPYNAVFAVHMLAVDWLLIWIPTSRIAHFVFYFFSRPAHGVDYARRGVAP